MVFFKSHIFDSSCVDSEFLTLKSFLLQLQGVEDGSVDSGPAASGRCSAPDAVAVRSTLPHRSATLPLPVDREPALVSLSAAG